MPTQPTFAAHSGHRAALESAPGRTRGWMVAALAGFALGVVYLFWPAFASGFERLPGDLGDFRFVNLMLEHWYRVVTGQAPWRDPNYFYPQPGVLGYSDALFLHAVPYVVFRLARLSPFYAYFCTLVAILGIGYAGTLWLLRRILDIAWPIAIATAMIFMFSNMIALKIIHANLYAVAFVPLVVGLLWRVVAAIDADEPFGRSGVLLAVLTPMLLYTSYYMGWLVVFLCGLWGLVFLAQQSACSPQSLRRFAGRVWSVRYGLMGLALVFAVALVPFVLTHYRAYLDHGPRPWSEVLTMLPSPVDLVNIGWGNRMWSWLVLSFVPPGRPTMHELVLGLPPGMLLLFATALAVYAVRLRAACGRSGSGASLRDQALTCLAITVVICWILMVKVGDVSLWSLIFKLVPGATAIRAVFRLQFLLHLAILALIAIALDRLWRERRHRVAIALVLVFLMAEQVNSYRISFDARGETAWLRSLQPPPASCRYFLVAPEGAAPSRRWFEVQIDAMAVAQYTGLPTAGGYSSVVPPGWSPILQDVHSPDYAAAALDWLRRNDLRTGLCLLDLRTRTWWSPRPDGRDLRHRNLIREKVATFEDGLALELKGFHALETIGRWTTGDAAVVPANPIAAHRILVTGQIMNPQGSRVRIAVNRLTMMDRTLGVGPFRFDIPYDGAVASIEIASTAFVPNTIGLNRDTRQLGVVVDEVTID